MLLRYSYAAQIWQGCRPFSLQAGQRRALNDSLNLLANIENLLPWHREQGAEPDPLHREQQRSMSPPWNKRIKQKSFT